MTVRVYVTWSVCVCHMECVCMSYGVYASDIECVSQILCCGGMECV